MPSKTAMLIKTTLLTALILVVSFLSKKAHKHFLYNYKGSSVVMLKGYFQTHQSGGTGFQVVTPSGNQYTMTNYHVCMLADKNKLITAMTNSGTEFKIKIKHYSKLHDMCLLEPIKSIRPLKVASYALLNEEVHIIGHPRLEARTIESGSIVSYYPIRIMLPTLKEHSCKTGTELKPYFLNRQIKEFLKTYKMCEEVLLSMHTNAISYGGNSGSPVLDDLGNIVGILFAGTPGIPTSSLVVPLKSIQAFLDNK